MAKTKQKQPPKPLAEIRYFVRLATRRPGRFVYVGSVQENNRGEVVKFRQVQTKEQAFAYAKFHAEDIVARLKACRYFPEIEAVEIKKAA